MIDLYYYPSPNSRKVLMALEELQLPYQIQKIDIREGDQFSPEFVQVNPNSKIPAIVDHDGPEGRPLPLFESGAILMYLAEKTGKLLPGDPARRWQAICWIFWQVSNQGPMAGQATHFLRYAPQQGIEDEYAQGRYRGEIHRIYEVMEQRLTEEEYLAGDFSMADIACYGWAKVAKGHGVDVEQFPHLKAWRDRIDQRPSAQVRPDEFGEERALKMSFTEDQWKKLFRPPA